MDSAPPPLPAVRDTAVIDQEHLRLLAIFHYVVAGVTGLFSLMPLIHVAMGAFIVFSPDTMWHSSSGNTPKPADGPPEFIGWFFMIFGGLIIVFGLAMAVLILMSGRRSHNGADGFSA